MKSKNNKMGRNDVLRWIPQFFLSQVLLLWLIGLIYLPSIHSLRTSFFIDSFVLMSYLTHFAWIAIFPMILMVPLSFFSPLRSVSYFASIMIATGIAVFLFIDALVYNLYQYHLNSVVLRLAYDGITQGIFGLSFIEKGLPLLIFLAVFLLEWFYARWLWRKLPEPFFFAKKTRNVMLFCMMSFMLSYLMIFHHHPATIRAFIQEVRFLPFYIPVFSTLLSKEKRTQVFIEVDHHTFAKQTSERLLHYPKQTLQYTFPTTPLNLVMIAIDSWRFDMLNQEVTPSLLDFSKKAWVFHHHFSGGNSTGPGIFTLFYGVPASYSMAMEAEHRGPLLLDEMMKRQFQLGIFSSAPLYTPPLDRSVFQSIPSLDSNKQPGETVYERDEWVTKKFLTWLNTINRDEPFFSFLFFDAAHSYCGTDKNEGPFQPTAMRCNRLTFNKQHDYFLYLNRYKNALYSIDQQIKQVLDTLESEGWLDRTVVMIVGDHGEEFDDTGKGYLGHASHFTPYQVQTPLIVYWPQEKPHQYEHRTSHFDVAPTLMSRLLGCKNNAQDYSIGTDLLDDKPRSPLIMTSYVNMGVIENDKIITIFPSGDYEVEQWNGDVLFSANANTLQINQMKHDLYRFYQNLKL